MHGDALTYERLAALGLPDEDLCERFIRAVDPGSFPLRPIYICFMDELGDRFTSPECGGYTSSILDLVMRPFLEWQGRGPAIVLQRHTTGLNVRVALHEYAHRLECIYDDAFWEFDPAAPKPTEPAKPPGWEKDWRLSKTEKGRVPWHQHEPIRFGRLAAHLAVRASKLGAPCDLVWFAGEPYGVSPFSDYVNAVGDEAQSWIETGRPLIELCTTPPPPGLVELIDADKRRWLDRMLDGGPEDRAKLHAAIASEDSLAACVAPEAAATVHRWGCCKGAAPENV